MGLGLFGGGSTVYDMIIYNGDLIAAGSFYDAGGANSIVSLIAGGLKNSEAGATIIYNAENNNHAAEILEKAIVKKVAGVTDSISKIKGDQINQFAATIK